MSSLKTNNISNLNGTLTIPTDTAIDLIDNGTAKAWVNFNGTGTVAIRAAYNVTSITDNGTGDYTVNFTTAMPDANYAACFGSQSYGDTTGSGMVSLGISPSMTASGCRIYSITWGGGLTYRLDDKSFICASFFS